MKKSIQDSLTNSTRPLKKNTSSPSVVHKIAREETLSNSSYKVSKTLIKKKKTR